MARKSLFAPVAALLALMLPVSLAAKTDSEAEAFLAAILKEAEPSLLAETEEEMFDGIALLVDKHVDMRRVGYFTLGKYARKLTDEQKGAYFLLFEDYARLIYQNLISGYAGYTLEVTSSKVRSARDTIVNSKVSNPKPGDAFADATIHWRVYRNRDGEMSVVDSGIDNVWLAIEQRSQFQTIIANNGGAPAGIDALLDELRAKVGE